ncbi:MAG: kinase, partial [Solobacterium sp.]|nr:kinase [Solobacterium sp.]
MPRIWIIGGANIDLCGKAVHKLRVHDSNIGHIELRYGGVGRNIAQICCLLKERVNFVSCFSTDDFGKALMKDCEDLGMHLEYSYTTNAYPSSLYIALLDEGGDMYMGMNDMRILESLPFERIQEVCSLVKEEDILVIDGNLEEEVAQYIVGHCKGKIVADPVSIVKAKRLTK